MKDLLLASTSTIYGSGYLEYLLPELELFFKDISQVLFVPYAQPGGISCDEYTQLAQKALGSIGKQVVGLHTFSDKKQAVLQTQAIFVGGGNTFLLTKTLYDNDLMDTIRTSCLNGTRYLGTSAGTNLAGQSIQTTNDMPIVYPPSFKALGLVPLNFNPHYLDPDPQSKHKGETREMRILEFHKLNDTRVVGLREGSFLRVKGQEILLKGRLSARIFCKGNPPYELAPDSKI